MRCFITPQTERVTGNIKAEPILAKTVLSEGCAPKTPSVRRRFCAMSGRTIIDGRARPAYVGIQRTVLSAKSDNRACVYGF